MAVSLCWLGSYDEAIKMFDMSLRCNKEESTALVHEGIRLATGNNNSGNGDAHAEMFFVK
ncbi:hypothetical protein [Rickettsia massiliae]|uniref:hypothetical protein n=1 Tax=Rickettsia massiliae TaxID=35791 RepID=UPI0002E5DD79|nr:hypothetical protein [Rickettsia massiliae]